MGGREFSGIRRPAAARAFPFADDKVASYAPRLGALLKDKVSVASQSNAMLSKMGVGEPTRCGTWARHAASTTGAFASRAQGVEEVVVELQPDASHTNKAWAERLPRALAHLGACW